MTDKEKWRNFHHTAYMLAQRLTPDEQARCDAHVAVLDPRPEAERIAGYWARQRYVEKSAR